MPQHSPAITPATPTTTDAHVATWSTLLLADTCAPVGVPEQSDRTVQIDGTFGGATAGIEGSVDGVTFFTLHDPQGVAISGTSPRLSAIVELVAFIRGFVNGGDGTTSINIRLLVKKAR